MLRHQKFLFLIFLSAIAGNCRFVSGAVSSDSIRQEYCIGRGRSVIESDLEYGRFTFVSPTISAVPLTIFRLSPKKIRDVKLESYIQGINSYNEDIQSDQRYFYSKFDLDNDGADEIILVFFGNGWCGTGGCTAEILKIDLEGNYKMIQRFTLFRNIYITFNTTNGWNDIIMNRYGGGDLTYIKLRFDMDKKKYIEDVQKDLSEDFLCKGLKNKKPEVDYAIEVRLDDLNGAYYDDSLKEEDGYFWLIRKRASN